MGVYTNIDVWDTPDGGADIVTETNDPEDRGYPGYPTDEPNEWMNHWRDREACLRYAGFSRVGFAGNRVTVRHNGKERKA